MIYICKVTQYLFCCLSHCGTCY